MKTNKEEKVIALQVKQSDVIGLPVIAIKDTTSLTEATEVLSRANRYLDQVIEYKESKTKPLNQALKVIRAETKPLEDALNAFIGGIRKQMGEYAQEVENKRVALAERVGEGKLKLETAMAKMDSLTNVDDTIESESGSITFKDIKKFEVVSLKDIPIDYHIANEVAIRKAMLDGQELAGVRYFIEKVPTNRR